MSCCGGCVWLRCVVTVAQVGTMVAGEESEDDESDGSVDGGATAGAGAGVGVGPGAQSGTGDAGGDSGEDGETSDGQAASDGDDDAEELDLEFLEYKGVEAHRGVMRMADGVMKAIKPPLHHIALRLVELQEAQQVVLCFVVLC
jgi:hypothetical protein